MTSPRSLLLFFTHTTEQQTISTRTTDTQDVFVLNSAEIVCFGNDDGKEKFEEEGDARDFIHAVLLLLR